MASTGSVASPSAVWMWVVATEVMLLAVGVLLLKLVVGRWGLGGCVAWRVVGGGEVAWRHRLRRVGSVKPLAEKVP